MQWYEWNIRYINNCIRKEILILQNCYNHRVADYIDEHNFSLFLGGSNAFNYISFILAILTLIVNINNNINNNNNNLNQFNVNVADNNNANANVNNNNANVVNVMPPGKKKRRKKRSFFLSMLKKESKLPDFHFRWWYSTQYKCFLNSLDAFL